MKSEEIESLSKQELVKRLKAIYSEEGIINSYLEFEDLLLATAEKMADFRENIDLTGEDATKQFKIIGDYMKNVVSWSNNQKELKTMIDEELMREAKEKRLSAANGTLEQFVNDGYMRDVE